MPKRAKLPTDHSRRRQSAGAKHFRQAEISPLYNEKLLTMQEARKLFPGRKPGKSVDISVIYRWAEKGLNDILLETVMVGSLMHTSREAIIRFNQALTEMKAGCCRRTQTCSEELNRVEQVVDEKLRRRPQSRNRSVAVGRRQE